MHARTNTHVLLYFFFFGGGGGSFSPLCPKYTHSHTLYTRILLSLFTLVPHHTHERVLARAHTHTHTHTLALLSFICQRWCHNTHTHTRTAFFYLPTLVPQHTLTFTLTHSELTHARSLCYELTDATEIIMTHTVLRFFFFFFFFVFPP